MRKFRRSYLKCVGIGVALGAIAAANASDQITYNANQSGPGENVSVNWDNHGAEATEAEFIAFNVATGTDGLTNPFWAVCGDIVDQISPGQQYSVNVITSPFSNTAVSGYTTQSSVVAAGNIVGNNFDSAFAHSQGAGYGSAAQQAAGLQIAVWAAEYDNGSYWNGSAMTAVSGAGGASGAGTTAFTDMLTNTTHNTNDALLTLSGNAMGDSQTMADAYADWQTRGTTPGSGDTTLFLQALTVSGHKTGQDQWTESSNYLPSGSPEPFTMGIGIAGVTFAVRRKVKRSK